MNLHWLKLLFASVLEVGWVIGLAHANSIYGWFLTIAALLICNYFLITSTKVLPAGTAYTFFVGLGTAGTVLAETLFFHEPVNLMKISFILLLLIGVMGLKLVTDTEERKEVKP